MLRSLKDLEGYTVSATDADVGSVVNLLLDDRHWTIRYLVVETGDIFGSHQVLVTPVSFREVDWATHRFHLALTSEKVKSSPGVDTDEPVSRVREREFHQYLGYPFYGDFSGLWGPGTYPGLLAGNWTHPPVVPIDETTDVHLRSVAELRGYQLQGTNDAIGHIEDFVVDDESWQVRYLVIDTSEWWSDKKVLVSPRWATHVDWAERKVFLGMTREAIKASPEWDANAGVNREYETRLYDYHGRPAYWEESRPPAPSEAAQKLA